jgi:DNA-binding NtrC family response regulator
MNRVPRYRSAVLLVDTRGAHLRRLSDTLQRAGHHVIEAASFEDAKHALVDHEPGVLITALRLAAFNGLHLVHLGRLSNPELNAIVLSTDRDVALHDEVHLVGATLLIEPLHTPTLLDLLQQRRDIGVRSDTFAGMRVDRRRGERRQSPSLGHTPERRVADRRAPEGSFDQPTHVVRVTRLG